MVYGYIKRMNKVSMKGQMQNASITLIEHSGPTSLRMQQLLTLMFKSQTYSLRNILKKSCKAKLRQSAGQNAWSIHRSNSLHPLCPALHSPNSSNSSIQTMYLSQIPKVPTPTSTHTISSERAMRDENIMLTWDPLD